MRWVLPGKYIKGRSRGLVLRIQELWGLEPTRNLLTVFTLTVGLRIDCRGVGTKTEAYYCSNLGKRSGWASSREWVEFSVFCFLNLVLEQN